MRFLLTPRHAALRLPADNQRHHRHGHIKSLEKNGHIEKCIFDTLTDKPLFLSHRRWRGLKESAFFTDKGGKRQCASYQRPTTQHCDYRLTINDTIDMGSSTSKRCRASWHGIPQPSSLSHKSVQSLGFRPQDFDSRVKGLGESAFLTDGTPDAQRPTQHCDYRLTINDTLDMGSPP